MTADTSPDPDTVLAVLIETTADVIGVDPSDISPDDLFGDLDVDSVFAVDIVVRIGDVLGDVVNPRDLLVDWTDLSMRELAANLSEALAQQARSGPPTGGGT